MELPPYPLPQVAGDDDDIATGWIQMPGEIKERARDLQRKIRSLNGDIDRAVTAGQINPDSGRYAAWKGFVLGYGQWLGEVGGGSAPDWVKWGWSDVAATLDVKARELRDWYSWFARTAGPTSAPAPTRRSGAADGLVRAELPGWAWGVMAVAGVWGVATLVGRVRR